MNNNKTSKLSAIIGILLSIFALQAQSDCGSFEGFVDNKDGTVTDPRSGTIWKRCAEGEEFDGKNCSGNSVGESWLRVMQAAKDSRFLGKDDWRIPTAVELYNITGHSPGFFKDCKRSNLNDTGNAVSKKLSVRDGVYWSTTRQKDMADHFMGIDFVTGDLIAKPQTSFLAYRLVRAGTPSPTEDGKHEKQFEFDREYTTYVLPVLTQRQMQKSSMQEAVDKKFQETLKSEDPQAMYLAAGKYRRNGFGVEAEIIYETIISRFPSSPWAVKANDQLESSKPVRAYVY